MAYETNRFCWHGAITQDPERTAGFYAEVLGQRVVTAPMGDGEVTMLAAGGEPLAHVAPPSMPGVPNHWQSYLRVDDVDASTAKAAANGGKVLVAATDIPPGRFSVVATPSGATLALFHEADAAGSRHHAGGPGGVHWVELHSKDLARDVAWLERTFGFTVEPMAMPDGTDYKILNSGGQARGGAMTAMAEAPAMWLVWFHVPDLDAALARATRHGGSVVAPPMEVPGVGRMAIVVDPVGAAAGIITPSQA